MTKRLIIAALLTCLLAACGNKGPLVKPDAAQDEAPAVEAPASEETGDGTEATEPVAEPETDGGTPAGS